MKRLALPFVATRDVGARKATMYLIYASIPAAIIVGYGLNLDPALPTFFAVLLPLLVCLAGVLSALLLASKARSADVLFDKEYITVKPVKILGLGKGRVTRHKLSDFTSITAHNSKRGRYYVDCVILRAKRKGRDLYLDVPPDSKPEGYMYQLSRTLNLETDSDA